MKRYITLEATNKRVPLGVYVNAIKIAKANPDQTFKHGLGGWWSVTGVEIVQEFRDSVHDRINRGGHRN